MNICFCWLLMFSHKSHSNSAATKLFSKLQLRPSIVSGVAYQYSIKFLNYLSILLNWLLFIHNICFCPQHKHMIEYKCRKMYHLTFEVCHLWCDCLCWCVAWGMANCIQNICTNTKREATRIRLCIALCRCYNPHRTHIHCRRKHLTPTLLYVRCGILFNISIKQ